MRDDTIFWLSVNAIAATAIVLISYFALEYNDKVNEKILKADTCVKVVKINGDDYNQGLALCGLLGVTAHDE